MSQSGRDTSAGATAVFNDDNAFPPLPVRHVAGPFVLTHVSAELEQGSNAWPIIDGHVAPQRGNYSNSACINYEYPMGYGHVTNHLGNLIQNAD